MAITICNAVRKGSGVACAQILDRGGNLFVEVLKRLFLILIVSNVVSSFRKAKGFGQHDTQGFQFDML